MSEESVIVGLLDPKQDFVFKNVFGKDDQKPIFISMGPDINLTL
jgi:hypothetical protein